MRPTVIQGRTKSPRPAKRRMVNPVIVAAALLIVPVLLVVGMEVLHRGSLHETGTWMASHPKLALLNGLLAMLVFLFLYGLVGRLFMAAGLSVLLLSMVALISFFKKKLIGEPFFPWDIFLNKESMNILPLVTSREAVLRLVLVFGTAIALFAIGKAMPRMSPRWLTRLTLVAVCGFGLYAFGTRAAWLNALVDRAGMNEIVWNQQENYGENGLALAFTMNVKNTIVPRPPGYSESAMAGLADSLNELVGAPKAKAASQTQKPNVIFIMNEAFWDPTLLKNVKFSEDPLPTVHRLQKEMTSGFLLSPQFGGGTSNVEFEILSGQSMSFMPAGSVPYQQYISRPLPSLASYFKSQGYASTAIHSYERWFWNRENVYRYMGFDEFISKEGFDNPVNKGAFIADDEVSRRIIQEVEENEEPTFIYAVTMQNHGPYDDNRYGDNPIKTEGLQTAEAKNTLETYVQGASDADRSLQLLIDHFEQSDEPTVIVFYGDHLPMLGYDYDVYAQAGFVSTGRSEQWSLEELKSMHSVPFVMWTNEGLPKEHVPTLSTSFLGAYVLNRIGLELPAAWAYNAELAQKTPGLLRNLVVDSSGQLYAEVPPSVQEDVEIYRELQYDEMFGHQYVAKYLSELMAARAAPSSGG
ncbi:MULTISPECIES: LTA synthase family protein [Paenibacillus]|nr:LTA synthase family protein [Paenibacillus validus]